MRNSAGIVAFTFAVLMPPAAMAQTPQPLDPLATIEQFEDPSGNPSQLNYEYGPGETASGLYQITITTWNSIASQADLPQVGPGTAYANVAALSADVQQQGAAYLYSTQGFGPWTCSGCDAPLANYIQQQGGPSAFALTSDEQALLDGVTPGGISPNATVAQTTPTATGTIGQAAAAGGVTAVAGSVFAPFTWLYTQYQTGIAVPLSQAMASVQSIAAGPLISLLVIMLMTWGVMTMYGKMDAPYFAQKVLRMAAVVALVAPNSAYYQNYVVNVFNNIPTWFGSILTSSQLSSPAQLFDRVLTDFNANAIGVWWNVPWSTSMFVDGFVVAIAIAIVYFVLGLMFAIFLILQALTSIMLVLGPVFILGLLFDYFRGVFDRWVFVMIGLGAATLAVDVLVTLVLGVAYNALSAMPNADTMTAIFNLLSFAEVVVVLGVAIVLLPPLMQLIMSSSGAVSYAAAGAVAARAVGGAARGIGKAAGKLAGA
jgi:type IV secretion system protein VirB6